MAIKVYELLTELEKIQLNEIGEANSKPFPWQNKFYSVSGGLFTIFLAPIDNQEKIPEVTVLIAKKDENSYSIGFEINDDELQAFKTTMNYYLRVLSTVVLIIKSFIEQYNPESIIIRGIDKQNIKTPGQESRIYFAYIEKQLPLLGSTWESGRTSDGLTILNRK